MNIQDIETFEFNEDTVENFDDLNNKYRDNYDWINEIKTEGKDKKEKVEGEGEEEADEEVEVNKEELAPREVFKILTTPMERNEDKLEISGRYFSKQTDPFQRLIALKHELGECKKEIDEYAEAFKGNEFVLSKEDFSKVYDEINTYKSKVDAFIDYNIYNGLKKNESDSEVENTNNESSSLFEKNNILISSLITNIKNIDEEIKNNILNGSKANSNEGIKSVSYEVVALQENQLNLISSKISELESGVNMLEKILGDWSLVS